MKKVNALIAAVLTASLFTSCGGTDTAEMTETSAETEGSVTTVSEETTATVSETDTLSAESEETTAETSAESEESILAVNATEEAEMVRWDTIVYDTTNEIDVTGWGDPVYPDWYSEHEAPATTCNISAALSSTNVPDSVTSYLYEQSWRYKDCVDNDKEVRQIVSGVKDFDFDGTDETFYAVNYLYRMGDSPMTDIVVYNDTTGVVYWSGNDIFEGIEPINVGYYFDKDPAIECHSMQIDDNFYEHSFICEGTDMFFTADNMFIGSAWDAMMYNHVSNHYYRLTVEDGVYHIDYVGTGVWGEFPNEETGTISRKALVGGAGIPCVLIQ